MADENENREYFKRALAEVLEKKTLADEAQPMEMKPTSRRHKIRMNRLLRERVRSAFLPYPEVDSFYERARSQLVKALRLDALAVGAKKRRKRKK